jgi:hypothetical protein
MKPEISEFEAIKCGASKLDISEDRCAGGKAQQPPAMKRIS